MLCTILTLLGCTALACIYVWATQDLPEVSHLADYRPPLATKVLARDGTLIGLLYKEKRFLVSINEMMPMLPKAFLAAEDAEFYSHKGINPLAILRAFISNVQAGRATEGGSTITQQIIKRLVLSPERSYERKVKEAILAYRLEQALTKDEILSLYLNQTFFGANAYGVEAAARTFFGKHASDLTLAECAVIAGLPKAPSSSNPYSNPESARNRQLYVLRRLNELKWITEAEYEQAVNQPLVYQSMPESMGWEGSWYLEEVRRRLINLFSEENAATLGLKLPMYGQDAVYQLGLTVQTAMDPRAQHAADAALRSGLEAASRRHGWQGPLEKIPKDRVADTIAQTHFDPAQLNHGAWAKAVVVKVSEKDAQVRLGPYSGVVDVKSLAWARTPNPKVSAAGAGAVRDVRKVLEPGDLIWVSAKIAVDPKTKAPIPFNPKDVKTDKPIDLNLEQYPEIQGALVSLEPKTGDVVAMVGGYSFAGSQFIRATQALRQPGSSFKPIVYSAALDNGYTAGTVVVDSPVVYFDDYTGAMWRPGNYEKNFQGPMLLRTALALSRNLVTIRVAGQIGIDAVIDRAHALGIEGDIPAALPISLGAVDVTPLSMAQAYGVFANGGKLNQARFVVEVKDHAGKSIYAPVPEEREVITPQNAYVMASLLKEVVNAGTGARAKVLGRPVGGKTGTTNEERDAWFIGITPHLATAVYLGYDQVRPMGRNETGGVAALPVFVDYARSAFEAYPPDDFPVPEGISFVTVDKASGRPSSGSGQGVVTLPFYTGTEPGGEGEANSPDEEAQRGEDLLKLF